MAVLLFGFGPFQEYTENPSQLIVQALDGTAVGGEAVRGVVLPVEYEAVEEIIASNVRSLRPPLILGTGLAPGRAKITPEKIAINYRYSREPDNAGRRGTGERVDPSGPDGIFTNAPVEELVEHLNSQGIPSELSLTAGSFVCNAAMYIIVREARSIGAIGAFIHLPAHEGLAARLSRPLPSMSLETMTKGVKLSVEFLLQRARGQGAGKTS